jgi:hypothetical protein
MPAARRRAIVGPRAIGDGADTMTQIVRHRHLAPAVGVLDAVEVQASGGQFVEVDGEVDRR